MRLVSRKTIELMTADHLPPDVGLDPDVAVLFGPFAPLPVFGSGFGLRFSVRTSLGRTPWGLSGARRLTFRGSVLFAETVYASTRTTQR